MYTGSPETFLTLPKTSLQQYLNSPKKLVCLILKLMEHMRYTHFLNKTCFSSLLGMFIVLSSINATIGLLQIDYYCLRFFRMKCKREESTSQVITSRKVYSFYSRNLDANCRPYRYFYYMVTQEITSANNVPT